VLDDEAPRDLAVEDTLVRSDLPPGAYRVAMSGAAPNCAIASPNPREVIVVSGVRTDVAFTVTCGVPLEVLGTVEVGLETSGVDLDADGYRVFVGVGSRRVGPTDAVSFNALPPGPIQVRLDGLSPNCTTPSDNPITVQVPSGGTVRVNFAVTCWPPATGRIAFSRRRAGSEFREIEGIALSGTSFFPPTGLSSAKPSFSPDGTHLAYADDALFPPSVFIGDFGFGDAIELKGCEPSGVAPVWSPGGGHLLCMFDSGSELYSYPSSGGTRQRLARSLTDLAGADWSVSGKIAIRTQKGEVYIVDPDGRNLTPILLSDTLSRGATVSQGIPVCSPDGRRIAYVRPLAAGAEIDVLDVQSRSRLSVRRRTGTALLTTPRWSPDGTTLLFTETDVRALDYEPDTIVTVRSDGSNLRRLGLGDEPSWSPDGTKIVFSLPRPDPDEEGPLVDAANIYLMNADGTGAIQLSTGNNQDREPAWGP
jgi:Tol biopolymer transport system component